MTLQSSDNSRKRPHRRNLLLALGFIIVPILWTAPTFIVLGQKTETANSACRVHLQRIGQALETYAGHHDGKLPPANSWVDELLPIVGDEQVFRCPADKTPGRSSYALNQTLAGRKLSEVKNASNFVLLYETAKAGENPVGSGDDVETLGKKDLVTGNRLIGGRHNGTGYRFNYYLLVDGTERHPVYGADLEKYRW